MVISRFVRLYKEIIYELKARGLTPCTGGQDVA